MAAKNPILVKFGHNVRDARLHLGISQEALAFEAGLDRTYMGGVERGERNLGLLNVARIAQALKISPALLFKDIE
ncbi:MAG: helix-turn-helix transcriptional regulator [Armatimonadetes bacterium]|nr:helix-turn-helix transcriptional regulator [Armatimonadota bacterium]